MRAAQLGVRTLEHWYGIPDAAIPGPQRFPATYSYDNESDRFRWAADLWRQADSARLSAVLDTMLATGGSAAATVDILKKWGAARIKQVSLIAAPEGVATLSRAHPDVDIHIAALDSHLNERGYIVPGLGDAGDRQFGTFAGPSSEPGHGPDDETAAVVRRLQRHLDDPA